MRGLGRIRDGINYLGEHLSNLGKNVWRQGKFIWENDDERADRVISLYGGGVYEGGDTTGGINNQTVQNGDDVPEKFKGKTLEEIMKIMDADKTLQKSDYYADAAEKQNRPGANVNFESMTEEEMREVMLKDGKLAYAQSAGAGAAMTVLEALMNGKTSDLDSKVKDLQEAYVTKTKEYNKISGELNGLNAKYASLVSRGEEKGSEGKALLTEMNNVQTKLNSAGYKKEAAFATYNTYNVTKAYVDDYKSGYQYATDKSGYNNKQSDLIAKQLCCVIATYLFRVSSKFESRDFGKYFMDELNAGNITKGTEAVNLYNASAAMNGNYGKNEPIIESFGNLEKVFTDEQKYVAQQLLALNSADWAMVYADTASNPDGKANHFFLIYKDKETSRWKRMDHTRPTSEWGEVLDSIGLLEILLQK